MHASPSPIHLRRAAAALAAGAALGAAVAPSAVAAPYATFPEVMCAMYRPATDAITTRFTYDNRDSEFETIPIGEYNFFTPDPINRGQMAQFVPGRGASWFDVTRPVGTRAIVWELNTATATAPSDRDAVRFGRGCAGEGPEVASVVPPAVRVGVANQRVTLFGQGLAGAAVSARGDGVSFVPVPGGSNQRLDLEVTVDEGVDPVARDLLVTGAQGIQVGCGGCLGLDAPAPAVVAGPQGPAGPEGRAGAQGAQGPAGADGAQGPAGAPVATAGGRASTRATSAPARFSARHRTATAVATCPAGTTAVGGGHTIAGGAGLRTVSTVADHPLDDRRWSVTIRARGAVRGAKLRAIAVCM